MAIRLPRHISSCFCFLQYSRQVWVLSAADWQKVLVIYKFIYYWVRSDHDSAIYGRRSTSSSFSRQLQMPSNPIIMMEAFLLLGVAKTSASSKLLASPSAKWIVSFLVPRKYSHNFLPISFTRRFSNTPSPHCDHHTYCLTRWSPAHRPSRSAATPPLPTPSHGECELFRQLSAICDWVPWWGGRFRSGMGRR